MNCDFPATLVDGDGYHSALGINGMVRGLAVVSNVSTDR